MGKESLHANSLVSVYGRAFGCGDFLFCKLKIISTSSSFMLKVEVEVHPLFKTTPTVRKTSLCLT